MRSQLSDPQLIHNQLQHGIPEKSVAGLFSWTLTHYTPAFSEIEPVFTSHDDLIEACEQVGFRNNSELAARIENIALRKISIEWNAWVDVHSELHTVDEAKLDNKLMTLLYRFVVDRDLRACMLCQKMEDLTIHHIIPKRRNLSSRPPPFGRSVPTNLVTLCRKCHSHYDVVFCA